jgi:hypothetical protein
MWRAVATEPIQSAFVKLLNRFSARCLCFFEKLWNDLTRYESLTSIKVLYHTHDCSIRATTMAILSSSLPICWLHFGILGDEFVGTKVRRVPIV